MNSNNNTITATTPIPPSSTARGMDEIEKKTEAAVKQLKQSSSAVSLEKELINIMKSGEQQFKKNNGRTMTYAEMRQMYG